MARRSSFREEVWEISEKREYVQYPTRSWLLPLMAFTWNQLVYLGARLLAEGRPHSDWTLPIDNLIPFLPCTVAVYFGCFLFWAFNYLLVASREKGLAYRFFCADFLAKAICFACFVLLPTTNVRPAVDGHSVWEGRPNSLPLLFRCP